MESTHNSRSKSVVVQAFRPAGKICAVVLACAAVGCATNPATGQRQFSLLSEEQELEAGRQNDAQVRKEMGVYADRAMQEYVTGVGIRLAAISERPSLPWHFTVVDVPAINAFALPGGYVYITRGILPFLDDESQLACVLGHEIGHVTARHSVQQYSKATGAQLGVILGSIFMPGGVQTAQLGATGLGVLFLKNSRDDEAQADELGVRYAARAGWDPAGMPRMLTTLARVEEESDNKGVPNWLLTHPAPADRVQRVQSAVQLAESTADRFKSDHEGYLQRVNGLEYGDNPDQGVVRGHSYVHRGLRFAFDFPDAWSVENGQTQVVAREPGGRSLMILQTERLAPGRTIEDVAVRSMQRAGFRTLDGSETTVNGLPAFIGTYAGTLRDLGRVQVRAAHLLHDREVFLVAGVAPLDAYSKVEPAFAKSLRSFRALSAGEAEAVQPNRIALYIAQQGDTWQSIAERQGKGLVKAATLAIMNGRPVADQPRPGERLKIVASG
jgi:predicted Zn-dependent protease